MLDDIKMKLIYLSHYEQVGWKAIFELVQNNSIQEKLNVWNHPVNPQKPLLKYPQLLKNYNYSIISEQIRQYSQSGIEIITFFDEKYPDILKEIYQPPWVIYAKGNLSLLDNAKINLAIVGARQATEYSLKVIEYLMPELVKNNLSIVSGLAAGVDSVAHRSAIRFGGNTIGVIAGGFNHIYPKENAALARFMMENHLVLSEHPPDVNPTKWMFPMRNRIISGISNGTLIVEAKKRSGSLITANFALNEGREVFAIPGDILSPYSLGTNELLQQGAKLVMNASDILEDLILK